VLQLSALAGTGVDAFWDAVTQFKTLQTTNGKLAKRREKQARRCACSMNAWAMCRRS
jgi:LAO/AO transport system kinase